MGLDLSVYIVDENNKFSHDILSFDRHYDLFDRLRVIKSIDFNNGDGLTSYFGESYCTNKNDCYGDGLKFVTPDQLLKVKYSDLELSNKNNSILQFLCSLSGKTKIVLYWH